MESVWKTSNPLAGRCINIDWLECYCLESGKNFPHNADYFREQGYTVIERGYGTRQYNEMFTVCDAEDRPFIEVRRNPVSGSFGAGNGGVFSPYMCHLRLVNRYCYHHQAVSLYSEFLMRHGFSVQRLYRLDLALDFEKFDKGDDPKKFLERYMRGKYSKINQGNVSSHGKDRWEGRDWNSISWGAEKSMVTTKLYNKTLELREAHDKPYIRYAWMCAELVDDYTNLTKRAPDGSIYKPDIWRVEFSVRSSARGWFVVEDETGRKSKRMVQEHTLATYADKVAQLHAFANLAHHYFHFKQYIAGQRKDRCPDKVLFDFGLNHAPYKLDLLLTDARPPREIDALRRRLEHFRLTHFDKPLIQACDVLLDALNRESVSYTLPVFTDNAEVEMLRALIARRIKQDPKEPMSVSIETVQKMLEIEQELF